CSAASYDNRLRVVHGTDRSATRASSNLLFLSKNSQEILVEPAKSVRARPDRPGQEPVIPGSARVSWPCPNSRSDSNARDIESAGLLVLRLLGFDRRSALRF